MSTDSLLYGNYYGKVNMSRVATPAPAARAVAAIKASNASMGLPDFRRMATMAA
jgi:hypothetical protein